MSSTAPTAAKNAQRGLDVKDLSVEFFVDGQWLPAAQHVSYEVKPGEILAIVGESGSGKSQSSMSLVGLLPPNGRAHGQAFLDGQDLFSMSKARLRHVRGKDIAVIFQEPMTALNPVYTIGYQIIETIRTHFPVGPKQARERALELLKMVEIPEPERRINAYPHELSGGQRQRAMIAQALACDPKVLIADEPTTALDVTVQAEILALIRDLRERIDSAIILITHDMGVVADMADTVLVMKDGFVVERGPVRQVFYDPQHPYTQRLLASVPHLGQAESEQVGEAARVSAAQRQATTPSLETAASTGRTAAKTAQGTAQTPPTNDDLVLSARGIDIVYEGRKKGKDFKAVAAADLDIARGEVVGLVGESGSGKTTVGRAIVGLLPVREGSLEICGISVVGANAKTTAPLRSKVGIVFQDPGSSLNPRFPIGESIGEPLYLHRGMKGAALSKRVEELLDQVELPRAMRNRYPHELSGGQRQRVGIARALALEPELLVADEPTSALDVSVQAKVLDLFKELQQEHGFACLFISHDLAVVEMLSDRIAVMHHGKIVEVGTAQQVVHHPIDDYTQRLLAAVPLPNPDLQQERRAERDRLLAQHIS